MDPVSHRTGSTDSNGSIAVMEQQVGQAHSHGHGHGHQWVVTCHIVIT